jgi:hypothetical protein
VLPNRLVRLLALALGKPTGFFDAYFTKPMPNPLSKSTQTTVHFFAG